MSRLRILVILTVVLSILFLLSCFAWSVEGFEDKQQVLDKEIQTYLTLTGDILCPVYEMFISQKAPKGSDDAKRQKAIEDIVGAAGGPLFPCPPPNFAVSTPADIEDRTRRTIQFFKKQLESFLNLAQKALDCQPGEVDAANIKNPLFSGFQDFNKTVVCTQQDLQTREDELKANATRAGANANTCVAPQDLSEADTVRILKARKDALARILDKPETANELALIKQRFEEYQSVVLAGEQDKLTRSCQL
jgi:hypothetical protein